MVIKLCRKEIKELRELFDRFLYSFLFISMIVKIMGCIRGFCGLEVKKVISSNWELVLMEFLDFVSR